MELSVQYLVYATVFRVSVIAAAIVCIVLGYRLFIRGGFAPAGTGAGGTEAEAQAGEFKLTVRNAAPGTCFALFGAAMIAVTVIRASPELSLEMQTPSPAQIETALNTEAGSESLSAASRQPPSESLHVRRESLHLRSEDAQEFDRLMAAGHASYQTGDADEALRAYFQALALEHLSVGQLAGPLNAVAWIYQELGKLDEALPLARAAVHIQPDTPSFLQTLAMVLLRRGNHAEALKLSRQAVRLDPDNAALLATLAQALEAAGERRQALVHMLEAARLDPTFQSQADRLRQNLQ